MESIIFIAPPAAGKGTQAELLTNKYHLLHISTGDILRDAAMFDNDRGRYVKEQMELGNLVSDEIIHELITERLQQPDCDNGYILDGFPRDIEQALAYEKILEKVNKKIGKIIYLNIDEDTVKKRILGRISCSKCGAVYNDMFDKLKPIVAGICDNCGDVLMRRGDDNAETFEKRFQTYIKNTQPLIEYYQNRGILYTVDSNRDASYVFADVEAILNGEI